VASTVYYITSTLFPAKETYLDAAILPDDASMEAEGRESEDLENASMEKDGLKAEVKSAHSA
jgi:nucleobase:cation symporter-1, NCS1 family